MEIKLEFLKCYNKKEIESFLKWERFFFHSIDIEFIKKMHQMKVILGIKKMSTEMTFEENVKGVLIV